MINVRWSLNLSNQLVQDVQPSNVGQVGQLGWPPCQFYPAKRAETATRITRQVIAPAQNPHGGQN